MPTLWRMFIALKLPSPVIATLSDVQDLLRKRITGTAVKWVEPDNIHLTLKFLGDVAPEKVDLLRDVLQSETIARRVFELETGQGGCFPNPRRPRTIWVGVGGNLSALSSLQQAIETSVAPLGFPPEKRPFRAHLTLGRVRKGTSTRMLSTIGNAIESLPTLAPTTWSVQKIALFRSELTPGGPIYTLIAVVPLKASDT